MAKLENSSSMAVSLIQAFQQTDGVQSKKKRNLPGMPDPEAEVISLSPKSLLATNRFICEICNKGFQREQNLQLHRRGHNLPWKLRQRTDGNETRKKRVYVCPETSCVHHNPARALGDLTGIKKHYCRKHCEKKWRCERCSKTYAVKSDWTAHIKSCGTKEYKCNCGTVFSRAYCDALAEENTRAQAATSLPAPLTPSTTTMVSPGLSTQSSEMLGIPMGLAPPDPPPPTTSISASNGDVLVTMFASTPSLETTSLSLSSPLYLSNNSSSSIFTAPSLQPAMSATALLQKAAQMGAAPKSSPSLLRGQSFAVPSSSSTTSSAGHKPTSTLDLLGLGICGGGGGGRGGTSNGLSALFTQFGGGFNGEPAATTSYGAANSSALL
ncbi:protein indeterminate-domain 2-like [Gossypium australe]|uniref:Protein indeterminate-domain 2-like n=1 Tax=Gossypium australe TaxID=47621 RepID=A0A5B6W561_9ROSI|nr:protein indeterminate-domain 2-like [Gossypium australe]